MTWNRAIPGPDADTEEDGLPQPHRVLAKCLPVNQHPTLKLQVSPKERIHHPPKLPRAIHVSLTDPANDLKQLLQRKRTHRKHKPDANPHNLLPNPEIPQRPRVRVVARKCHTEG